MEQRRRAAFVYGVIGACGGLGTQTANALAGLARGGEVSALGPPMAGGWPLPEPGPVLCTEPRGSEVPAVSRRDTGVPAVSHQVAPPVLAAWERRLHRLRGTSGSLQLAHDRRLGAWAAGRLDLLRPSAVYAFTQVALESLRWARRVGVPAVLESPNGHLRGFRRVVGDESRRWCGRPGRGHPTAEMVERVEEEYDLADLVRVSSRWAKASLVAGGVPAEKIEVLGQTVNLERFRPAPARAPGSGPLRLCFVGSLDLRKGFVYLLRALRRMAPATASLEIVGATGDPCCRRLLARERSGLDVVQAPGDPRPALARAELFVLPTLEDGSPFALAEAMACGLPVVATTSCGAAEWVEPGASGWLVPPADPEALAAVLTEAAARRPGLHAMGEAARQAIVERAGLARLDEVASWLWGDAVQGRCGRLDG